MSRPQEFIEDQALDKAMELFWEKGFNGSSMQDLVNRTGVCRASLYKTFGNKEELFARALQRYQVLMNHTYAKPLDDNTTVKAYLRNFFLTKITEVIQEKPAGCMVINATTELYRQDVTVREMLLANEKNQRTWLASLLAQGIERGELPANLNVDQMAHYLFLSFQGITINAMTQARVADLEPAIDLILAAL